MRYTNGNYEAFARPRKPAGAEEKTAWILGSGLAGLSAAAFLVRDAQVPGENIHILEQDDIAGGALDGIKEPEDGFVIRGGREMENHFECLWDLFRSVPSLEIEGASVLDEFYWLNKDDPNYSLQRATQNRGEDGHTDGKFTLSKKAQKELIKLFLATREEVENVRINEWFGEDFLDSNFWLYWRTMFAFEEWHSALEMKLYVHRFIHHLGGLPDFSALKFTKYNQYESLVLPLTKYLQDHGVKFEYGVRVTDVDFHIENGEKQATYIHWVKDGQEGGVALGDNDLAFLTIGSLVENSDNGNHHRPATLKEGPAPAWDLWRKIAAKDESFGHPDVFGSHIPETKWESCTVTTLDERIPRYIEKIAKRDPFSGKVVTGGIVTARDSSWLLSWTVNRQPHFKNQPKDQIVVWVYALYSDARRLHRQDHRGVDRRGDHARVALPPGRARRGDRRARRHRRQGRPGDDALRHGILHAARRGRPPGRGAGGREELRLHRPVRRVGAARLHLHHRVLRADPDGGRLHAHGHRARRA